MIEYIESGHNTANSSFHTSMPRKLDKNRMEEAANFAALVVHIAKETQNTVPISDEVMQEQFIDKFRNADTRIEMEIQMANTERAANFAPRSIPTLAEIMDTHSGNLPACDVPTMSIEASAVEEPTS